MDQFIHLPGFRVIICKKCQYVVLPSEVDAHFANEPVHGLSRKGRRFFIQGLHSNLFRVEDKKKPALGPEGPEVKMEKEIQRRIDKVKREVKKKIEVSDKAQEPNPWLRRVKFDEHLQGLDRDQRRRKNWL